MEMCHWKIWEIEDRASAPHVHLGLGLTLHPLSVEARADWSTVTGATAPHLRVVVDGFNTHLIQLQSCSRWRSGPI